jgi:hypothetical protein
VKQNEALIPIPIGLFCGFARVLPAKDIAQGIQQVWFVEPGRLLSFSQQKSELIANIKANFLEI